MLKNNDWFFKNLANMLTVTGLLMAVWLLIVAIGYPEQLWLMLLLTVLIGLTDFFDGKLAKRLQIESTFGKALDRLRDKIFVCPTLLILVWRYLPLQNLSVVFNTFTIALISLIILIECLLFSALIFGIAKNLDISSNKFGKAKMFCEFVLILVWLIILNIEKYLNVPVNGFSIYVIDTILIVTAYLAVKSIEGYSKIYQR
ncbi:MAG: hypothetical protein COU98_01565 [Candidatus Staskawiczbacteria bacterium CG10_big_fil_rev_8_21_14_0_10_38_10]|uniref:CDP-diacylglycerol--glycerol-3-phosphate 3-phosphatidyltransferase n=1 Tax=Candidatus Staskawiczbacteria bacterium CG10_big_fil_rev_8_21_14_0_10_38_10 TaxID=1974891 RepID=A0A2H9T1C7_9BACT|nr:MAG: hypothetical protein COU98_01565 [Candidatus Staskawiczbacteria bacterium CG10_big_fil_rev_8_21_14_0_10_38_10]